MVLPPVSSNTIYDAKAKKELQMMDISDLSSPLEGGKKIIILCEKVTREDIKVRQQSSYFRLSGRDCCLDCFQSIFC